MPAVTVSMFLMAGFALARFAPVSKEAKKDGWWIRVSTREPEPRMMGFYLGATEKSYGFWNVWNPGSPAEFDVSEEYRNSPSLFVLAQTTSGRKCDFCLMYTSRGARYFEFDLEEDGEVTQSDEDANCR